MMLYMTSCESDKDKFEKLKVLADQAYALNDEMKNDPATDKDLVAWEQKWDGLCEQIEEGIDAIPEDADFPEEDIDKITDAYKLTVGMGHSCKLGNAVKDIANNFQGYSTSDWDAKAKVVTDIVNDAKEDRDNGLIRDEEWAVIQQVGAEYMQMMQMFYVMGQGETTGTIDFD
jgi:hypothetical protein